MKVNAGLIADGRQGGAGGEGIKKGNRGTEYGQSTLFACMEMTLPNSLLCIINIL
jgi:hypothetical protein